MGRGLGRGLDLLRVFTGAGVLCDRAKLAFSYVFLTRTCVRHSLMFGCFSDLNRIYSKLGESSPQLNEEVLMTSGAGHGHRLVKM